MPLLDVTTTTAVAAQYSFQLRPLSFRHGNLIFGNDKRLASAWDSFIIPQNAKNFNSGHMEISRGRIIIKAVATLEPVPSVAQSNEEHEAYHSFKMGTNSSSVSAVEHQFSGSNEEEDPIGLDEREKLRRMRISKANKGNTPWNKGKKHSPETLQRIRERTRLAMQDPKVKMKLVNLGHAQSKETRIKIGVGVRMGWEKRREKLMVQETCLIEWQNLIAEASRKGFFGEEELQWDSYNILDEELEQEWLESIEQRKKMPRPRGSKRAPKSLEQRRKISEAIAAKWADPEYRERVYSGLSRYHGTTVGVERKRRRPSGGGPPRIRSPIKKKTYDFDSENPARAEDKSQILRVRLKRSNIPLYKDPQANSKLEMIKNIRAQRAAVENKKAEAISRAKLLIAEAEKAAKALEVAATRSPLARASLIETRKLIAEAIQSIELTERELVDSHANDKCSLFTPAGLVNYVQEETYAETGNLSQTDKTEVNVDWALESSKSDTEDFHSVISLHGFLNGQDKVVLTASRDFVGSINGEELDQTNSSDYNLPSLELSCMMKPSSFTEPLDQLGKSRRHGEALLRNGVDYVSGNVGRSPTSSVIVTKKWVRGRLVEVAKGDHDEVS